MLILQYVLCIEFLCYRSYHVINLLILIIIYMHMIDIIFIGIYVVAMILPVTGYSKYEVQKVSQYFVFHQLISCSYIYFVLDYFEVNMNFY